MEKIRWSGVVDEVLFGCFMPHVTELTFEPSELRIVSIIHTFNSSILEFRRRDEKLGEKVLLYLQYTVRMYHKEVKEFNKEWILVYKGIYVYCMLQSYCPYL